VYGRPCPIKISAISMLVLGITSDTRVFRAHSVVSEHVGSVAVPSTPFPGTRYWVLFLLRLFLGQLNFRGLKLLLDLGHLGSFHLSRNGSVPFLQSAFPVRGSLPQASGFLVDIAQMVLNRKTGRLRQIGR